MAAILTYACFIVIPATPSKECKGVNEGSYMKCGFTPQTQKRRRIIGETQTIKMLEKIRNILTDEGDKKINS